MLYCLVQVPWPEMIRWLEWLDEMAPEWAFSYPEQAARPDLRDREIFRADLQDMALHCFAHLTSFANMKVCMTEEHMMLHKLAWDVVYIKPEPFHIAVV